MPKLYRIDENDLPDLEALPDKIRRKVMRQAAKVVGMKARELAPDSGDSHSDRAKYKLGKKGKLRNSIKWGTLDAGRAGVVRTTAPHAHLVALGTKAHQIPQGNHRWTREEREKRRRAFPLYAGGHPVQHPGAEPNQFLIRAKFQAMPEAERLLKEGAEEAFREIAEGAGG